MPIFPIIIVLIVACLAWWLIDLIPIGPPQLKLILRVLLIVLLIIWLLGLVGFGPGLTGGSG